MPGTGKTQSVTQVLSTLPLLNDKIQILNTNAREWSNPNAYLPELFKKLTGKRTS